MRIVRRPAFASTFGQSRLRRLSGLTGLPASFAKTRTGGPGMPAEADSRVSTARRVGSTVWTGAQRVDRHNSWGTLADAGATLAVGVCVVIVAMVL